MSVRVEKPADDFGARLRGQREVRGVTLSEIAAATKVSVAQLEALERNDISRLPGGIFLRSIVRSYAQEVGADPESTVRDFISSFPADATDGVSHTTKIDYEKATTPRRGAFGVILAAIVLVALIAALLWLGFGME
jgi:cytoskeletal protein RodZ